MKADAIVDLLPEIQETVASGVHSLRLGAYALEQQALLHRTKVRLETLRELADLMKDLSPEEKSSIKELTDRILANK